ncbi:putative methyltransferase-domain-containing protein, partial [Chytriomyces cf. hyalinus JEL632]
MAETTVSAVCIGSLSVNVVEEHSKVETDLSDEKAEGLVKFIAGKAWPAGLVLAEYFIWRLQNLPLKRNPNRTFKMLELGAGTGVTSLFVGKTLETMQTTQQQVEIFVSDLDVAVPLIVKNIHANFTRSESTLQQLQMHGIELDWTKYENTRTLLGRMHALAVSDTDSDEPVFDLIYASDVVYFPYLFEPLIQTLVILCTHPEPIGNNSPSKRRRKQPELLLTCRMRELSKEHPFYAKLGKYFHLVPLDDCEWDNGVFWEKYRGEYVMFRCVLREVALESEESDDFETMLQGMMDVDL